MPFTKRHYCDCYQLLQTTSTSECVQWWIDSNLQLPSHLSPHILVKMTFLAGFFSGFALTTSLLYVTLQVHRSNRLDQRNVIQEQVQLLHSLASPAGAYDRRFAPENVPSTSRSPSKENGKKSTQPSFEELLKHRWNREVEILARKAHESRWEDVKTTAVEGWKAAIRLMKKD